MRVVFLTTADPLYLPTFFERVLERRATDVACVYVVPPLYGGQSRRAALARYRRTFGVPATARLAKRVVVAKAGRRSVAHVCRTYGVDSDETADVNAEEFLARLRGHAPDVIVSVSCPQIFRAPLIGLPPSGVLNVHGALLPANGDVWVRRTGPASQTSARVDILDVHGKLRAILRLPPRARLFALGSRFVYLLAVDTDGFQTLVRYDYPALP